MDLVKRYFAEISFRGTAYHGWQNQENAIAVQGIINKTFSTVLRQEIETVGCGRTDTGVHARQLFAHFDVSGLCDISERDRQSINSILPYDIAVSRFVAVHPDAHARFDASSRSYEYHIHFRKDPFKHEFSWYQRDRPDLILMNEAARILMEYEDFTSFSKSNTQTFTNNCKVTRAEWFGDDMSCTFFITADRFLRNMVRAIVGTLLKVGRREIKPSQIRNIIESKSRSAAGESVPARGLYLTNVTYPYIP